MLSDGTGQPLLEVILQFFQEEQWSYQLIENKPVVRAGYRGERGTWVCYARVDEESRRFVFYSLMGMNISQQSRGAVAEYITRVNYALQIGNFEMNFDSGDIRFRTSLELPDSPLTVNMVRSLAYANVQAMDQYFPGVVAVVHGGLSPEAALARVEAQGMESVSDRL